MTPRPLVLLALLTSALSACASAPAENYTSRATTAEKQANLEFLLNLGSAACLGGVGLGCNFVRAYEYCMQGSDAACADARAYGRLLLTAAELRR